jgi:hypothetical protein
MSRVPLPAPAAALAAVVALATIAAPAGAADRHVGYYYPKPASTEVYTARAKTAAEADRRQRILFVVNVVEDMNNRPFPPGLAFFAKGAEAEKLIIVSNHEKRLNTVYRVRALLAMLTGSARATRLFKEFAVDDIFTFLDMLKLLGFTQVTISDGDAFAHQIKIE